MKHKNHVILVVLVCLLVFGCDGQKTLQYSAKAPANPDSTFQLAYTELMEVGYVGGPAVDFSGERGDFHRLFETLYEYGTENDFETMACHKNVVVRTMGLLTLKYRNPGQARIIAQRWASDTTNVCVRIGCIGFTQEYGEVTKAIMKNDDWLDTKNIARRIDEKRKR